MSALVRHSATVSTIRAPLGQKHRVHATLAQMVRRGEITHAFNARIEGNGQGGRTMTYAVDFVRACEPRSRTPLHIAVVVAALSVPATIGALLWHSRVAILAGLKVAAVLAVPILLAVLVRRFDTAGRHGHCPGAWHK